MCACALDAIKAALPEWQCNLLNLIQYMGLLLFPAGSSGRSTLARTAVPADDDDNDDDGDDDDNDDDDDDDDDDADADADDKISVRGTSWGFNC
ncbi:hypothetical protein BGW38_002921 [Lunasporangiospora selenospora]|uniref:Uncharacterized protein n=1 Tax=Lunasporangiospora selenospora TaxID=979761 RepID=A0A9P6KD74_9FUNG|nr:hypothetical protein BGW38_002921 [Lunasporangiospora selenospora]